VLALQLYQQQRFTRAATETVLGDMAGQITDAERALEPVKINSPQSEADRDAALAAIHAGVAALLTSRDELEQRGSVGNMAALKDAGGQVDSLLAELRGSQ
jgi:soluble cytochrome b562